MKKVLLFLFVLVASQFSVLAKKNIEYQPVIKLAGNALDLRNGKNLTEFRAQLEKAGYKDITAVLKPKVKNVLVMEGNNKGATNTFELYYLPDGRIYEIVMSVDSDKDRKYSRSVTMQVQKIAFNNVSNALYKELGSPEIKEMQWDEPYTQADWEDHAKTAEALASNKLFVFFGYVSSKYLNTEYKDEPTIYITLDPLLRVRMGVKDIELFKLHKAD